MSVVQLKVPAVEAVPPPRVDVDRAAPSVMSLAVGQTVMLGAVSLSVALVESSRRASPV